MDLPVRLRRVEVGERPPEPFPQEPRHFPSHALVHGAPPAWQLSPTPSQAPVLSPVSPANEQGLTALAATARLQSSCYPAPLQFESTEPREHRRHRSLPPRQVPLPQPVRGGSAELVSSASVSETVSSSSDHGAQSLVYPSAPPDHRASGG